MGATGKAIVDFGAIPGKSDASVDVTGQANIAADSLVEAWLFPSTSDDHSSDEHLVETIRVVAGNVVAGVGFTIYAFNTNQLSEPNMPLRLSRFAGTGIDSGLGKMDAQTLDIGGKGTRIYGKWNVAWVWK